MITKIIVGFFALRGFISAIGSTILLVFPKSKAAKFIIDYLVMEYDADTYERVR